MRTLTALATLSFLLSGCVGGSPQALSVDLQAALDSGDMDAALALGDFAATPPDVLFFYMDLVADCAHLKKCSVSLGPYDEATAKRNTEQAEQQGLRFGAEPDSVLVVATRSRYDSNNTGKLSFPIGKVDGRYRVLGGGFTPEKLAQLRAQTTQSLADAMLQQGIYDPVTQTRRSDWKEVATALPADGGEVGQWFVNDVLAEHKVMQAGDLAAAIKRDGPVGEYRYGEKDETGQPVPRAARQLSLRAQSVRNLAEVRVLGGYQYGDDTVLLIEGTTTTGWIERGAVLLSKLDGAYGLAGRGTVQYPAP